MNIDGTESSSHSQCAPTTEAHSNLSNLDDQILSLLDNPDLGKPKQLNSFSSEPAFPEASSDDSEEESENGTAMGGYLLLPQNSDEEFGTDEEEESKLKEELASSNSPDTHKGEHMGEKCVIDQSSGGKQTSPQAEATKLETSKK